jgi:hypothetical protein
MIPSPRPGINPQNPLPQTRPAMARAREKSMLVDLGLWALIHEQWCMVSAITALVQSRGLGHE